MTNLNSIEHIKHIESNNSLSNEENKKKPNYESLTPENAINITYLQTYCQSPVWQLEDYFVL
jgi:hypothetical protein